MTISPLRTSTANRARPRFRGRLRIAPLIVVGAVVILSALAPVVAPHDPLQIHLNDTLAKPWFMGGSSRFPLGTDADGRDILSRLLYGARVDIPLAFVSLAVGAIVGSCLGILAGYFRGLVEAVIMRLADVIIVYPVFLVAILFAAARGPSAGNVIGAVAFVLWPLFARVVRGEVLAIREREYVALALVAGASPWRIMRRHILPNVASTIVVLSALQVGWVVVVEASLSFLGAGVPPPASSWGGMISSGQDYLTSAWWLSVFPGVVIFLVVLAFNQLGDWLRDVMDPRMRDR